MPLTRECDGPDCTNPVQARGLCRTHYKRLQRTGTADLFRPVHARVDKHGLWPRIVKSDGCWAWLGGHNQDGYARVTLDGRQRVVHRLVYEQVIGPVPEGLQLDHFACDNQGCVNPAHLRPVTSRENNLRSDGISARNAAKTHCPKGHPYDAQNTVVRPKGRGRMCGACRDEYDSLRRMARASA